MWLIASILMLSCTNEAEETAPKNITTKVVAVATGDPVNPVPPIKP